MCHSRNRPELEGQSRGHRVAVCRHRSGVRPWRDGMITSSDTRIALTGRNPHHAGIEVYAGISALLAWFPASWASKIAPVFIGSDGGKIPRN